MVMQVRNTATWILTFLSPDRDVVGAFQAELFLRYEPQFTDVSDYLLCAGNR